MLGIDISPTAINMLEMTHEKSRYCVTGYGRWVLPEQVIDHGIIKKSDIVAHGIKTLFASAGLSAKNAVLAVPDSSTISKIIQVHHSLSEQDIEELVTIEAIKYMPDPTHDIHVDFTIMGPSPYPLDMQDVRLIATRAENVSQRVEVARLAGLDTKIVDVESFAIERVGERLSLDSSSFEPLQRIAIFDLGLVYTHVHVLDSAKIVFSHADAFGGKQLIHTMAEQHGVGSHDAIVAIEKGSLPNKDVAVFLQSVRELLLLQLKRSLHLFLSSNPQSTVGRLVLAGSMAKFPGLADAFQAQFNIPTRIFNPFAQMGVAQSINRQAMMNDAPMLLVACGLALRGLNG